MKLSDIMSQMGLSSYAEIGLLLFFVTFLAIAVYVYRTSREETDACARIPLQDTPVNLRTANPSDAKQATPKPDHHDPSPAPKSET